MATGTLFATNLLTNPSFEAAGAPVTIATNLLTNPSMEAAGAPVTVRVNLCTNPNFETNTTGWTAESGATIARDTTSPIDGVASLKLTGGDTYTSGGTVAVGDVITFSADYKTNGTVTGSPRLYIGTTNQAASQALPLTQVSPGRFSVTGTVAAAGSLICAVFGATAGDIWIDNVLIENSPVAGPYFDSTTPASGDFTYALGAGGVSVQQGLSLPGMRANFGAGHMVQSSEWAAQGAHSARFPDGGYAFVGDVSNGLYQPQLAPGKTYTLVGKLRVTVAPTSAMPALLSTFNGTGGATQTETLPAGSVGVFDMVHTFTVPADATTGTVRIYGHSVAGASAWWDDLALVEGTYTGPAFNGSTPAADDFTYAWTGTADASTSVQQGTLVAKTAMGNGQGIQSSAWSASGGKSVRLIPNTTSTATTLLIADTAGNYQYILVPGKTYTLVATRYLPAPLTGALSLYAGSFALITTNTGSQFSAQLPNSTDPATGTELRWTFTIPEGAGATTLRLGHGGSIGSGDVFWDNLALVEGTYTGPYFDGSNLPASSDINLTRVFWDGAVNGSTSEYQTREALTRPQTDDEWAATVNLMARYMHGVGTIAGPMVAQELESGPFNAYIVTFTLQATRPYIYSASTDLDLPPQIPIVYQDIPYNLAQYPSFELTDGTTPTVATNYVLNPSVETDATGWTGAVAVISGTSPAAFFTSGRVTGELSSVGNSSFRDRILGDGSTSVTNSKSTLTVQQTVDLSAIASSAGKRPSITVWAAATILAGASGSSIDALSASVQWQNSSGTVLRTDTLGSASAGTYNGHVFSQQSMVPPAGWSKAVVIVSCNVTWSSSSTPANNSDIRLYVDAMGITIP